jgi:hypothetical protein
MKTRSTIFALALFLLVPAGIALAGGAGGVGWGAQYYDSGLTSTDLSLTYITGYGYGVGWDGTRVGGFGMALISADGAGAGGVGGMVIGHEWKGGPLTAALMLFGGVGGGGFLGNGYMIGFGEGDFELGVRLVPWMQVTGYIGYQAWGNLIPGYPLIHRFYSPVAGIRVTWGAY